MLSEDSKILEFNQNKKSDKAPFMNADLEWLIKKIYGCKNNPENLFTTKIIEHILSGFSKSTISSSKSIENNHHIYKGKDCKKSFAHL